MRRFFAWLTGRMGAFGTRISGDEGERLAAKYLKRQGMRIIARQHRSRLGEIDLIALDAGCVVFIEVKTRRSHAAGRPEESVTPAKQKQLTRLALNYLKSRGWLGNKSSRFDVVSVTWPGDDTHPEIVHFRNAFDAVGVSGFYS